MKLILATLLFGFTAVAATPTFDVKVDLTLEGKKLNAPMLTLKQGVPGRLTQKRKDHRAFVEVVAEEVREEKTGDPAILMKFTIGRLDAKGKKTIITTSEVLTQNNQKAEIVETDEAGIPILQMSVKAKKK